MLYYQSFTENIDKEEIQNMINKSKNEYLNLKYEFVNSILIKSQINIQDAVKLFAFIESQNVIIFKLENIIKNFSHGISGIRGSMQKGKITELSYSNDLKKLQEESRDLKAELNKEGQLIEILNEKLQNKKIYTNENHNLNEIKEASLNGKFKNEIQKTKNEIVNIDNNSKCFIPITENKNFNDKNYLSNKNDILENEDYCKYFINNNFNYNLENKFFINNENLNEIKIDIQGSIQFKSKTNRETTNKKFDNFISIPLKDNKDLLNFSKKGSPKNSTKDGDCSNISKHFNESLERDLKDSKIISKNKNKSPYELCSKKVNLNNNSRKLHRNSIINNFSYKNGYFDNYNNVTTEPTLNLNNFEGNEISQNINKSCDQVIKNQPFYTNENINIIPYSALQTDENKFVKRNNNINLKQDKANKNNDSQLSKLKNQEKNESLKNKNTLKTFVPTNNYAKSILKNAIAKERISPTYTRKIMNLEDLEQNAINKLKSNNESKNRSFQSKIKQNKNNKNIIQSNDSLKIQNTFLKTKTIQESSNRKQKTNLKKEPINEFNDNSLNNISNSNSSCNLFDKNETISNDFQNENNYKDPADIVKTNLHKIQHHYENRNLKRKLNGEETTSYINFNENELNEIDTKNDNNQNTKRSSIYNFRNSASLRNLNTPSSRLVKNINCNLNYIKEESDEESGTFSHNYSFEF